MAVTDSQILLRLRREESLAEQQGRQRLNIAAKHKDFPHYDALRRKAFDSKGSQLEGHRRRRPCRKETLNEFRRGAEGFAFAVHHSVANKQHKYLKYGIGAVWRCYSADSPRSRRRFLRVSLRSLAARYRATTCLT